MYAHGAHAGDGADGARQFAFQRPRLVEFLLELVGGKAVAAVEDFVADGAAGRHAVLGQHQTQACNLIGRHHDLAAAAGKLVRHVLALQQLDHLSGLTRVEVGV